VRWRNARHGGHSADPQCPSYVLVVDDDPDIRGLLVELLETEGYAVITAPDGRVALDRTALFRPSLVVLDLTMPVMDGWTFLRTIRQRGLAIPILILTGEQGVADKLEDLSNVVYLGKPFFIYDLLALIESLNIPHRAAREAPEDPD
jgi:DNA-binding response OmpR family regulator